MAPETQVPLISCICITKDRADMLFKSILSFSQQSYMNKELVISYSTNDLQSRSLINHCKKNGGISIITIERNDSQTIGEARNDAIQIAKGTYICLWDDDDIYDPSRIAEQYNALLTNPKQFHGSVISQILLYHQFNQTAYLSFQSWWSCTLLCRKDLIQSIYCINDNQFECVPIINYLKSNNHLIAINAKPTLYTFVYHGTNLMPYSSFLYLINQSYTIQQEISQSIKKYLAYNIK